MSIVTPPSGVRVVGFQDASQAALDRWKHRFHDAQVATDADYLLSRVRPTFVVIAAPNSAHAGLCGVALRHGAHVEALEPPELRQALRDELTRAARLYG